MDEIVELMPTPVARPWGGHSIAARYGWRADAGGRPIGEWWLLACRENGPPGELSVVASGRHAGKTLRDLVRLEGRDLMGQRFQSGDRFPILVKLLDTADRLSVQLHPADRHLPGEGKTEAWYVLHAEPDGHLFLGLAAGVSLERFAAAEAGADVEPMLPRCSARAGQVAFLPATD
ncbi:MAG: type I phosphomannose isomerase catalytic subunit [Planctomycetota bacterium]